MLEGVAGLCQAYLLRGSEEGERIALTFWESSDAMRRGGEAIGAWQGRELAAGRRPGFVGTDADILTDLRVLAVAMPSTMPLPA